MPRSIMFSTERPCFLSHVWQQGHPEPWMMTKDSIYIGLTLYKLIESHRRCRRGKVDARDVTYQHNLTTERVFKTRYSKAKKSSPSYLNKVRKKLTELFSGMGIPAAEQPPILAKVMEILPVAFPVVPITVTIVDPSRCSVGSVHDRLLILLDNKLVRESSGRERYSPRQLFPATKSSIESLEKLRLNTLEQEEEEEEEEEEEAASRLPLCAICLEGLAEGVDESLTRLPCLHLYHGDCIAPWLEMSHLCPLCRCQMPNESVGNPPTHHNILGRAWGLSFRYQIMIGTIVAINILAGVIRSHRP